MTEAQWEALAYPYGRAREINFYQAMADIRLLRERKGDVAALAAMTADILAAQNTHD